MISVRLLDRKDEHDLHHVAIALLSNNLVLGKVSTKVEVGMGGSLVQYTACNRGYFD